MRLLFVTDNGFTEKDGKYYFDTPNATHISHLSKYFDEFVVVARKNPYEKKYKPVSNNIEVHLVNKWNVIKLSLLTKKLAKKCDAVIGYCNNGYFASKAGKAVGIPIIAYVGVDPYESLMCRRTFVGNVLAYVARHMWKVMAGLSDYCHYCHEIFYERYPTKGKVLSCSGVDIESDIYNLNNRIKKIEEKKDSKIILGLTGHTKNNLKGIDIAIRAIGRLGNNYYLEVVGRGDTKDLLSLARQCGCEKRVRFWGVKQPDEVLKWLDNIDIYIQPSRAEGLPRATIEAMSRACPVVCSDAGALSAIVDNRFVFKQNEEDKFFEMLREISNKEVMIQEAKKNFEESKKFEKNVRERKYAEFYSMIVDDIKKRKNDNNKNTI